MNISEGQEAIFNLLLGVSFVRVSSGSTGNRMTRCRAALLSVVLMKVLAPIRLYQIVSLEHALNNEIILLVALVQETLLNNG